MCVCVSHPGSQTHPFCCRSHPPYSSRINLPPTLTWSLLPTHTNTHAHTQTNMHAHKQTCTHTHKQTCTHTHTKPIRKKASFSKTVTLAFHFILWAAANQRNSNIGSAQTGQLQLILMWRLSHARGGHSITSLHRLTMWRDRCQQYLIKLSRETRERIALRMRASSSF